MMPEGWSRKRIGDFLLESRLQGSNGSNARRLTVKLYGKGVLSKDERRPGSENTKYYKRRAGQLIFSKLDFLNGAFGIIPPELDGYESTLDMPAFDFVGNIAEPSWILRYITRSEFYASQVGLGRGGRKAKRVNPDDFLAIELLMPPLHEQRAIAEILDSVDTTISATEATLAQTRRVKQALLQQLLTKGIDENGRPHTKFKMTEIGEIPEGWEIESLEEICSADGLQTGPFGSQLHACEYTETGTPVIMPANMRFQKVVVEGIARIPDAVLGRLEKHRCIVGDILFSRRGDIGRFVLIGNDEIGWVCGTGCLRARPSERIRPEFLALTLSTDRVQKWLNEHAVGQTMLNLNTSILGAVKLVVPSKREQNQILLPLESLTKRESTLDIELKKLNNLKRALMRDLLTGRVRVKDVKL